jgi:large subunit ribosomal protein L29
MKSSQIRDLRGDERLEKLQEMHKKLYELRCQSVTENLPNRHALRNVRKDIARIKTIMRQDEIKGR